MLSYTLVVFLTFLLEFREDNTISSLLRANSRYAGVFDRGVSRLYKWNIA